MCWPCNRDQAVRDPCAGNLGDRKLLLRCRAIPSARHASRRYPHARSLFLKSSIPENHKREQFPSERTTPVKTNPGPNRKHKIPIMSLEGGWVGERTQSKGRPAPPSDLFPIDGQSRAAHTGTTAAGSGSVARATPRIWRLLFSPQSSDEPIDSELGLGVRVVAAGAARAIALFSGAHVIVGQMMAPEARSEHNPDRLNARTRSASAHSSVLSW